MTLPTADSLDSHNCTTNPATKETAHCQPIYWQLTSGQKSKKGTSYGFRGRFTVVTLT